MTATRKSGFESTGRANGTRNAVLVAVAAQVFMPGCRDRDCTLIAVPAVVAKVEAEDGTPIVEATFEYSDGDRVVGPMECGRGPTGAECDRLVLGGFDGRDDFTLTLDITSLAFLPSSTTYEILSDGCHPETQDVVVQLEWKPLEEICDGFCMNAVACEDQVPWASVSECTETCVADVADPPPDECVPLYRQLYACLGVGTCDDYLAYGANAAEHPCRAHVDAIDECEEALGSG